jgi:uracil-DNA glycosylase
MRWTERQLAMLEAMGIRLWGPAEDGSPVLEAMTRPDRDTAPDAARTAAAAPTAGSTTSDTPGSAARQFAERRPPAVDASALRASVPGVSLPLAAPDAAPAGAAAAVWRALADEAAQCTACALCGGRTRTVFGTGHLRADWLILGDAPEADDDRTGEPFAGRAGRLLDNMLGAIGLSRSEASAGRGVYLTQAVKCQPPNGRSPAADELAACATFLRRQVELVGPRIILALGRAAAQALLGSDEPIGRLRGRVHRYAGVAVVVTHHPLFLLRHAQAKAEAWDDLCLAVETVMDSSAG